MLLFHAVVENLWLFPALSHQFNYKVKLVWNLFQVKCMFICLYVISSWIICETNEWFKYLKILTTNLHGLVNFQKFDWSTISWTWNLRILGEVLRKLNTAATDTPSYSRKKNWWVKNWRPALRHQWELIACKL